MTIAQLHTPEECLARLAELRNDFASIPATERTSEDEVRIRAIVDEAKMLDERHDTLVRFERLLDTSTPSAATGPGGGIEVRSGAQQFLATDEFKKWEARGFPELTSAGFQVMLDCGIGAFEQRANIADFGSTGPGYGWGTPSYDGSGAGMLLPQGQPIAPIPRRARLYMRDLMPVTSTTLASIPYVQELNPTSNEGGATSVAEGTSKPAATIAFQGAKADPTVIATTLQLSKQLFTDAPAVVAYLNGRLPYLVKFREDWELLNGNGTWPDMQGILNNSGIGSAVTSPGSSDPAVTIGNAFAQIENTDGTPTAVVMNPTDAWTMFTKRAASGSGTFDAGNPFSAPMLTVWGVPTYRTRAKAQGTALVGDFQLGGQIFDREQVNMQVYQERYAEQNLVLLLVEERVGVAWHRPDLFALATV